MTRSLLALMGMFLLAACSTIGERTQHLELGMTKAQAREILGGKYQVKGAQKDAAGAAVEVWEFADQESSQTYWCYFKDDRLVQWGTPAVLQSMPELSLPDEVRMKVNAPQLR